MIAAFLLGVLLLVVSPIAGCNGNEYGENLGYQRIVRSAAWKEVKAKTAALDMELTSIREDGERENREKQKTRDAVFNRWKADEEAAASREMKKLEEKIAKLRERLSLLPVLDAKPDETIATLSDSDFERALERWATKEKPEEWKQFVKVDDSGRRYKKSLQDMERKARKKGTPIEDEPGYGKATELLRESEEASKKLKAAMASAYAETRERETLDRLAMIMDGDGRKSPPLMARISSLDAKLKGRMEDAEAHLRQ